jgi:acyl carrier protein
MELQNETTHRLMLEQAARTAEAMRAVLSDHYGITEQLNFDRALDSLGLDSLSFVEYMFEVENKLKITLPDIPNDLTTLGDLVLFVDSVIQKQAKIGSPE